MDQEQHYSFKTCLLGDGAVGKTSLVRKFVMDQFSDEYITTIGTKVSKKELVLTHPSDERFKGIKVTLTIWDIVGQPGLHTLRSMYYTGADGALVVGDLTRKETFNSIPNWIASIYGKTGRIPIVLLANKDDLKDEHELKHEYVESFSGEIEAPHYYTSAKTGYNVERAFIMLAEQMLTNALVKKVLQPVEILDSMIADFCTLYGSLEDGMVPFQEVCEQSKINFHQPSIDDLKRLDVNLRARIGKDVDTAKAEKFYQKHIDLIQQLQS